MVIDSLLGVQSGEGRGGGKTAIYSFNLLTLNEDKLQIKKNNAVNQSFIISNIRGRNISARHSGLGVVVVGRHILGKALVLR